MKKNLQKALVLSFLLLICNFSKAQVSGYAFAASAGTYTSITGGTLLVAGTTSMDSWVSGSVAIPAFTFNCVSYTTAFVTSNGQLTLGGAAPSAFNYSGVSSTLGSGIAISAFSADLDDVNNTAASEMRYRYVAPEAIFQWKEMCRYGVTENFSFQIRLNTTTGAVVIVYQKNSGPGASTSYQPQVGIRTSATDYNNIRIGNPVGETWAAPLAGTANTDLCRFTSTANAKSFTTNQTYTWTPAPACSGAPAAGTATPSPASVCSGSTSTITLTGFTGGCGISYQWQSAAAIGGPYANIVGATSTSYLATVSAVTYYRCITTCSNGGATNTSSIATVALTGPPTYATLPYAQSFEGPWLSVCDTRERPDNSWVNTPKTGDDSWRREDDGVAAAVWSGNSGLYSPVFTAGVHSARFHSYDVCPSGTTGALDLYINLSPAGTKSLCFDYINTNGSDVLNIMLSTDGGSSFPTTLASFTTAAAWSSQSISVASNSATCVIRFIATGDCGTTDIGLDNMSISLPSVPNCATYTSPSNGATGISCGINAILNWNSSAVTACNPATSYDVYFGTSATPPFLVNQTAITYNPGTLLPSTIYYWKIVPRNTAGPATGCVTWSFTTGATFTGAQTIPPISDGFENCLDWTLVNGAQVNKWELGAATNNGGTNCMYVSNDGGATNGYTKNTTANIHFYKDISFPVNMSTSLSFDWKGLGEGCCDYIEVFLAPTTYTPVAGTQISGIYSIGGYVYNNQTTWQSDNLTLPSCGGSTMRLIFSWHNDGSGGTNPSGAIDNINIIAVPRTGQTCANPVNITLPFNRAGESTMCMNNDYTNASVSSCATTFESGEDKVYKAIIGSTGCINVSISNADDNSVGFQVYNGCPDAAGTTCIGNYGGAIAGSLSGDINIPAIGTYYFVVDNFAGPANVSYDISISSVGGNTTNDPACAATPLALGIAANGDNTCTNSFGEPAVPACWSTGTLNTVWYTVTVPASGDVYIRTTAMSLLNTQIAAYTTTNCASAAAFTYIACNDNAPACGGATSYQNSELQLNNVGAGNTIYIRVDGYASTAGTFSILAINGNNGAPAWPPVPGQDCIVSNPVCNATMSVGNPGYFAFGNVCDFPSTSTCLGSGERSSVWYTININANGNLTFDIVPNDYGNPNPVTGQANPGYAVSGDETDYDWALWKITGTGSTTCALIAGGAASVRCNYGGLGVTGLYGAANGIAPPAYPGFASSYMAQQPVVNGEVYALAISNFANNYVAGFSLVFGGAPAPVAMTATTTSITWAGTSNTSWVQPGNWSNACSAPTCAISATIASGGAQPIITANSSVKDLVINAGATLTINPGVILTVCGNFTNNGTLVASPTSTILFNNAAVVHTMAGALTGTNKLGHLTINKTGGSVILSNPIEIGGDFTTQNATSIFNANNQYVKIGGNFNTASNVTLINCPTIEFNGVIPQNFSNTAGTHALTNVVMNNTSAGVILTGTANSNMVLSGALTLTNGVIYTAATPILIMNAGSTSTSGSASSFVDGPMRKIGATAFVFPVGDAFNRWMPIGISAPSAASTFQAQYFYTPYANYLTMAAAPTPILQNVSAIEYWQCDRVAGAGNASLTLYWKNAASSGINSCAALQGGDLVVARWNGAAWENRSNVIAGGITGSCAGAGAGTVTSDLLTAFSPFTFGSKSAAVNPLPGELISFTGKNSETKNILEWVTGTETNNDYFTLERSSNGYSFEELSKIDGAGNSSSTLHYQHIDNDPLTGINYYRLKQTDFDGQVKYFPEIIALEFAPATDYVVYPNPASEEILLLSSNSKEETVNIYITDISGRQIYKENNALIRGNKNGRSFNISNFSEGIYYLIITDISGKQISQNRFVKTK